MRKLFIQSFLIKFIDKDLRIFNNVIRLSQHLFDYFILTKLDQCLINTSSYDYQIFKEIRSCMFDYMNKLTKNNLIFTTLADRKYHEYKTRKSSMNLQFSQLPKLNISGFNKLKSKAIDTQFKIYGGICVKDSFKTINHNSYKKNRENIIDKSALNTLNVEKNIVPKYHSHNNSLTKLNEITRKETTKLQRKIQILHNINLNSLTIDNYSFDSVPNIIENSFRSPRKIKIETIPLFSNNLSSSKLFKTKIKNQFLTNFVKEKNEKYIGNQKNSMQNIHSPQRLTMNSMKIEFYDSNKYGLNSVSKKPKISFFTTEIDT